MKFLIILLTAFLGFTSYCFPTTLDSVYYPQIGNPCPDFILTNVEHFPKSTVSLSDFKGKWLILDFWGEYCASCVESFPKLNDIQWEFQDDIQILMVGIPHKNPETIKRLFETHRAQKNLDLPIVYNKKLAEQFGVGTYPYIVIVDPTGMVRHITYQFNREHIYDMINNRPLSLPRIYGLFDRKPYADYDTDIPLLINGNGGEQSNHLFRSILSEANELTPPVFSIESKNRFEALGFDLQTMYKYAYGGVLMNHILSTDTNRYGKLWPHLFFETADTSLFYGNYETLENLYSYSIHVSDQYFTKFGKTEFDFRDVLRNNLSACFPYSVSVEKRLMPYNELQISDTDLSKIKSTAAESKFEEIGGGFKATKLPFFWFIARISNSPGYPRDIPLIYYGEEMDIDISLESIYYEDKLLELKNFGFTIVKGEKEMDVIVVRDKVTKD